MENFISEIFNKIIYNKKNYKCTAYIDDNKGGDKILDAFEIKDFSIRLAYRTAHEVLKLKYPNMGCDVRIYPVK